jgi:undecaprenyl-diphosphatase
MTTGVTVLLIGVATAAAVSLVSAFSAKHIDPVDTEPEKRKLVRFVANRPRLAHFVRKRLSRTSAGGLMLTVGFMSVLGLSFFVGLLFDMVDANFGFARFDASVARWGAANAGGALHETHLLFTRLGGSLAVTIVSAVVGIWGWWRYKNPHVALFMVSVTVGQALINSGLKWMVARDRPDLAQLAPWSGSSFPSGHAAAAAATYAAAALVLTLQSSRAKRALAAGLATFIALGVAATRAFLGVHWLTDVLAGTGVGFAWFVVCAVAFGSRIMRFGEPKDEVPAPAHVEERR